MMTPTPPVMAALSSVGISPKVFNDVAQSGHFLAGCLAIFAPVVLLGGWWRFPGAAAIVLFAAGKEFWYDARYETAEVRGSDLEDFSFYIAGALISLALYWMVIG
jgi:hypothetical protein